MSNMVHNLTQTPLHISSFAVFLLLLRLIVLMLSTFYAWSVEHIQRVFEAKTSAECLRAVDDTFSQKIELTLNGNSLPRIHLQRAILAMVESSGFQLTVHWQNAVEVPQDELNRNGMLGGYYIIRNLRKEVPGTSEFARFERHKSINVA
ncbi:hypothetical protein AcW1_007976 [Taiwanofungus camphoratus]|nr:hypothetical protein AcV5_008267 [Antrodia cinnamomea]KAI0950746.1 hypothetical protein AcW1_007976 [Antrodia cinnamomea]KAI0955655.1 hypothetical protein AcV7_006264 [Antrodia cinnamomea]